MTNSLDKIKTLLERFKGLTAMGSAYIVSQGISGIFWLFVARLLGTEHYGQVSYYIAIASIATTISFLGAGNTLIVYTAKGVKIQPTVYFIALISSVITSAVLFFMFYDLGVSLFVIGNVALGLVLNELLGLKLYKQYSAYLISQKIISVGLAIGLYYIIGINGIILGIALSFFPSFIKIYQGFKESKIDFSILKSRVGFIINSYMLDISRASNGTIDKIIVAPMLGFALLGNYQLGIQAMSILTLLPNIAFQYFLSHDASGNPNKRLKMLTIFLSVLLTFVGITLSPIIFPVLFPKFNEAIPVVQIMSISMIPGTINITYISKFIGSEKIRTVFIGSLIFLAVQIITIITLGKTYGVNGVAVAFVLAVSSETIYLIIVDRFFQKKEVI
ncbi:MAG: lipopolysaccharide biosynthesis protein [Nitrosotalea sp.]